MHVVMEQYSRAWLKDLYNYLKNINFDVSSESPSSRNWQNEICAEMSCRLTSRLFVLFVCLFVNGSLFCQLFGLKGNFYFTKK